MSTVAPPTSRVASPASPVAAPASPVARPAATVQPRRALRVRRSVRGTQAGPVAGADLRRRLVTCVVLGVALATVLLAVPDLRRVLREIADMNPALVAAAVALELASCLSFVVIFRRFFAPIEASVAREMAWSQMGSGALLPGGGVGALAVGGWLLHLAGMSTRQILQRSSGLFFLTSAVNVIALAGGGLALLLGIGGGPHDLLRAGIPVAAGVGAIVAVLVLPPLGRRILGDRPGPAWLADIGAGIPDAQAELLRPHWRLLGALGYLLFDIAVLWTTLAAVGPAPPVAALIVAYLAGYLANVVPIPGGIGVLDAGLFGALALYGIPVLHAAAAVLVYHAVAFWIPTLGGMAAFARLRPRLTSRS